MSRERIAYERSYWVVNESDPVSYHCDADTLAEAASAAAVFLQKASKNQTISITIQERPA